MIGRNLNKERWKPAVPKNGLLFMAGMIWLTIGGLMNSLAYFWLKHENTTPVVLITTTGFVVALLIHHFGFLRIVDRNLGRILSLEGRRCLFAFMPWKSYLLVMVMILGGIVLRHSTLPRSYLAFLYIAIGTSLMLSSVRYLRYLILSLWASFKE